MTYHLDPSDLQAYIAKVFGTSYLILSVTRMHGGAQKIVYKIECGNGFSCVLYVWDLSSNYFQEEISNGGLNKNSYGGNLFEVNNNFLTQQGIRTPKLYDINKERSRYPYDYALVEYVDGHKAEVYFQHSDSEVSDTVFTRIGGMLTGMHAIESHRYGKPDLSGDSSTPCHHLQMSNAVVGLEYARQYVDSISANYSKLLDKLHELESKIELRSRYGFIHGELGPDHILVNEKLEPYLIDIEGAEFFDIEHEHSFLQLRFGDYYRYLTNDTLDQQRVNFYRFHHHLSLISAGLKLHHRGFPDKQFAIDLTDYHSRSAMGYIEC